MDLFFMFNLSASYIPPLSWSFTDNDTFIFNLFGKSWTNFAISGYSLFRFPLYFTASFLFESSTTSIFSNPNTPDTLPSPWDPYNPANASQYYSLDVTPAMGGTFHWKANQLWNQLIPALIAKEAPITTSAPFSSPTSSVTTHGPQANSNLGYVSATWVLLTFLLISIAAIVFLLCQLRKPREYRFFSPPKTAY
jgi:hypothetical protein